jgi:hypothetical protein
MIVRKNVHTIIELDEEETNLLRGLLQELSTEHVNEHLGREWERLRASLLIALPSA